MDTGDDAPASSISASLASIKLILNEKTALQLVDSVPGIQLHFSSSTLPPYILTALLTSFSLNSSTDSSYPLESTLNFYFGKIELDLLNLVSLFSFSQALLVTVCHLFCLKLVQTSKDVAASSNAPLNAFHAMYIKCLQCHVTIEPPVIHLTPSMSLMLPSFIVSPLILDASAVWANIFS